MVIFILYIKNPRLASQRFFLLIKQVKTAFFGCGMHAISISRGSGLNQTRHKLSEKEI